MNRKSSNQESASESPESPKSPEASKTREFKNDPIIPGQSTKKRKIRRFYTDNKLFSYTVLLLAVIFLVSVVLVIHHLTSSQEDETIAKSSAFVFDDSIGIEAFQDAVLLKRFGEKGAEAFQSIRVTGTMQLAGEGQEFYLIKKRLNYAFLKLSLKDGASLTIGVNDGDVWRRLEVGEDFMVQSLEGEEAENFRSIGRFYTPFLHQVVLRDSNVYEVALSDDLGFESIKVEFQNIFKDCRSTLYLDLKSLVELQRIDHVEEDLEERVEFLDYQTIAGYQFPMVTEYYRNDVLTQKISLERVTVNPGVLSDLFEQPK